MKLGRWIRRLWWDCPALTSLLLALVGLGGTAAIWRLGGFERLDLACYDAMIRWRSEAGRGEGRVVIVGVTDADIRDYGWALSDEQLAAVLWRIEEYGPRVIGLDLYRDLPEPRTGEGLGVLEQTLEALTNVIVIESLGSGPGPPPSLAGWPERVGFNDLPADGGGERVVRRGLFYMQRKTGDENLSSFAWRMAARYLEIEGVRPVADEAGCGMRLGKALFCPFEGNDGAYVNADAGGFQFLIDYKVRELERITLGDLLSGEIAPDLLKGKVVLLGIRAESVNDRVHAPVPAVQHGVELHAVLVDQILRGALDGDETLRSLGEWQEGVWMAICALAGAGLGLRLRGWLAAGAVGGLASVWGLFGLAFWAGWWVPVAGPASGFLTGAVMVMSYRALRERYQREVLMRLFSRHLSHDIAEAVWAGRERFLDGDRPRPQKLMATVLFADLKGFCTVAERLEPDVLAQWVNRFLDAMAVAVHEAGGVVNKFIGDSILAVWGIPCPRRSIDECARDAERALRCALGMEAALADLNAGWAAEGLPVSSMRIGILTGPLVAASVGSRDRLEFTVLGDTVNAAARLESFDREVADPDTLMSRCRILLGSTTRDLAGDAFEMEWVGESKVKGKNRPISIYRLTGLKIGLMILTVGISMGQAEESGKWRWWWFHREKLEERRTLTNDVSSAGRPGTNSLLRLEEELPVYVPPRRGAPMVRVNAGSRSGAGPIPKLVAFAPDHPALSLDAAPCLWYWVSKTDEAVVEFTLVKEGMPWPLLEMTTRPGKNGLGCVDLRGQGVRLKPLIEYQWHVALVRDSSGRSKDIVASGVIEVRPGALEEVKGLGAISHAAQGHWYDAITAAITSGGRPGEVKAEAVEALLRQAGLDSLKTDF